MDSAIEMPGEDINVEHASKRLSDLMSEYLAIKKVEREKTINELHPATKKRILALKKLQLKTIELESEFHHAVYDAERKFQMPHDEIFKKRSDIINGLYEPTDDECKLPDVEDIQDIPAEGQETPTGVPEFWLTTLKNVNEVNSMIMEHDEPVLKYLIDVRAASKPAPDLSFMLEFHFAPNDFFKNSVLTKTYLIKCAPEQDDPFSFEGPEIYKSIGCEIMWNSGKNVTEKASKKRNSSICIFKTDSFFNFFNPPELKAVESEECDKIEEYLENDFEVGHYLKERVIPRAVLYFTGDIQDDITDDDSIEGYHAMENSDNDGDEENNGECGDN